MFEIILLGAVIIPLSMGLGHFLDYDKFQVMSKNEYKSYFKILIFKCWLILFLPICCYMYFQATHECTRKLF